MTLAVFKLESFSAAVAAQTAAARARARSTSARGLSPVRAVSSTRTSWSCRVPNASWIAFTVLGVDFALPLAFVMIAGPQILSAIFLATSQNWVRNTLAYLAGAALSITLIVSIAYLLSSGVPREGGSNDTLNIIVLVLLVAAGVLSPVATILLAPVWMMGLSLLYVDERVRHEGYDIELLVREQLPAVHEPRDLAADGAIQVLNPAVVVAVNRAAVVVEVVAVLVLDAVGLGRVDHVNDGRVAAQVERADHVARLDLGHPPAEAGPGAGDRFFDFIQRHLLAGGHRDRRVVDVVDRSARAGGDGGEADGGKNKLCGLHELPR